MTLVEVLVVSALFGIIAATLLTGFLTGRNSYLSADAYIHVQQQARQAFDIMTKELRNAGKVNNNISILAPGVQRLDFQIDQGYDTTACGGICWGDGTTPPGRWIHYELQVPNVRLVRYTTAAQLDPMPDPACGVGCRVLANNVNTNLAATSFRYDDTNKTVTCLLQILMTSPQLPGGSMSTGGSGANPLPLRTQIQLRNP